MCCWNGSGANVKLVSFVKNDVDKFGEGSAKKIMTRPQRPQWYSDSFTYDFRYGMRCRCGTRVRHARRTC